MGKHCKLCKIEAVKGEERSFHRFPDPKYQREAWCQALDIDIKTLKNWTFVCSDHFSPQCFIYRSNRQRFLKDDAVPFPYKGELKRIGRRKKRSRKEVAIKDTITIKTECEEQEMLNMDLDQKIKVEKLDNWEDGEELSHEQGYYLDNVAVKSEVSGNQECEKLNLKTRQSELNDEMPFQSKEISENSEFHLSQTNSEEEKEDILPKLFKLMYAGLSADALYFCKECTFQTTFSQSLRKHFIGHRETEFRKNPEKFKDYKTYQCKQCSYVTIQSYNLSRHMIKHLPNDGIAIKTYNCDKCEYSTKYRCDIIKHRVNHVPVGHRFFCTKCSYKAYEHDHFKAHMEKGHIESKQYKYECERCPYKTDSKGALSRHIRESHCENKPFKYDCKYCNFKIDSKGSLNRHMKQGHPEAKKIK